MIDFITLPFMRNALLTAVLAGNAIALIGAFVIPRRISFSGLAAAQLAALGAVVAVLATHAGFVPAALAFVATGLLFLRSAEKIRAVPAESWVGTLYVLGASIAVLVLSKAPLGESHTLNVFFGNILSLGRSEIVESVVLLAITVLLTSAYRHRWIWSTFDRLSAAIGGRARAWEAVFFLLFAFVITVGIHLLGVLLAFSYLVLPVTLALMLASRSNALFLLIPAITTLVTVAGVAGSFELDLPTGPFIAACFAVSVLITALGRLALGRLAGMRQGFGNRIR